MKIYLASSWRNTEQQDVLKAIRAAGFYVYDFKNPRPGDKGFGWSSIDPNWKQWTPAQFREGLKHPLAINGFGNDMGALKSSDVCVLLNPCGRSAHTEVAWAAGAGLRTIILLRQGDEPELMYLMFNSICITLDEVIAQLKEWDAKDTADVAKLESFKAEIKAKL